MRTQKPKSRHKRPGSVMIMVVALLVLLALMGTAWIAAVRYDRGSSAMNVGNNQLDEVVQGAVSLIAGRIDDGVRGHDEKTASDQINAGNSYFRPRSDTVYALASDTGVRPLGLAAYTYYPYETPIPSSNAANWIEAHNGEFLASRVPDYTAGSKNVYFWPAISAPLGSQRIFEDDTTLDSGHEIALSDATRWFESPIGYVGSDNIVHRVAYLQRLDMRPTFIARQDPDGVTRSYPAFDLTNGMVLYDADTHVKLDPQPKATGADASFVLAADTDGDGIADAGFSRLPIAQVGGITWYVAHRTIDNNSALNINTAWEWRQNSDRDGPQPITTNLFPTNVNGSMLLVGSNDPVRRMNAICSNAGVPGLTPFSDSGTQASSWSSFTSQYEALWTQVGSRIDNPGYLDSGRLYTPFSLQDQMALASGFVVPHVTAQVEAIMPDTFGNPPRLAPYPPSQGVNFDYKPVDQWFADNFDFASSSMLFSRRPLFVTRNGVSNFIARAMPTPNGQEPGNGLPAYGLQLDPVAVKANVNMAGLSELTRAYWNVMVGHVQNPNVGNDVSTTPFGMFDPSAYPEIYRGSKFAVPSGDDQGPDKFAPDSAMHPQRMFRSPIRAPKSKLEDISVLLPDPVGMSLIRSSIAAVNTVSLREGPTASMWAVSEGLTLRSLKNPKDATKLTYIFYAQRQQPFISEIYANNDNRTDDGGTNPDGYVAIELVNPYPTRINLNNWKIGIIDRSKFPKLVITEIETLGNVDIPGYGYLVIHNKSDGTKGTAKHVPSVASFSGTSVSVNRLHEAFDKEVVLLRPADISTGTVWPAGSEYAPVDSFDFTGFPAHPSPVTDHPDLMEVTAWHYVRANDRAGNPWRFVYPGRYDGSRSSRRQQGTQEESFKISADAKKPSPDAEKDKWAADNKHGVTIRLGREDFQASWPEAQVFPIQIANTGVPGPDRSGAFPFGGFARNGDILQVPFIGAYRVYDEQNNLIEINSLSMDAAFAEDTDTHDDGSEQIGRFCPVCPDTDNGPNDVVTLANTTDSTLPNDWDDNNYRRWRYRWAMRLFDYLTVQDPYRDRFPNVPPERNQNASYVSNADPAHPDPQNPLNDAFEKTVGVQGLVNINTAPWWVLAALPMSYSNGQIADDAKDSENRNRYLAQQIASYRDGGQGGTNAHGPYRTIYDLYRVPSVWKHVRTRVVNADHDDVDGDFSPYGSGADGVLHDFEDRFLFLTRISNMVTTRSDTFTTYLLVQGWRDAGTPNATLVTQKRIGLIIDRTSCTAENKKPRIMMFSPD